MNQFVVHGVPGSPYVRTALLVLEEKRLDWRLAAIPMGANRAAAYRAIHPFHKIPTLDHGDFRLYETRAILNYVDRVAPAPALTPADPRQAARMDQLIGITDSYVTPRLSGALSFQRVVAPMIGVAVDEAAVAAAIGPARAVVDQIARLLGDGPFMAGDALSLADLMLAPHLAFVPHYDEGRAILAPHAALADWIARMEARPSMAATRLDRLVALTGVELRAPAAAA